MENIAGTSFPEEDYKLIQYLCERHGVSASHVVRSCTGIGLQVYENAGLRSRVERAARHYGISERRIYQDAMSLGLSHVGHAKSAPRQKQVDQQERTDDEGDQKRRARHSGRVGGFAFSIADQETIHRQAASREVSNAHVVRDCASIGLAEYERDDLRKRVEEAALKHGLRERDVAYQAVKHGLDEAVGRLRVYRPLAIRDALECTDPELDSKLSDYIFRVLKPFQPVRLPQDVGPVENDDYYERDDLVASYLPPDWRGLRSELDLLHQACRESPYDENDRKMAKYLDGRIREEAEFNRRVAEAQRRREEALFELRGRVEE